MICTEIYNGQGLGNQLWVYATAYSVARRTGTKLGIARPDKFKAHDILRLHYDIEAMGGITPEGGPPTKLPDAIDHYLAERKVNHPHSNCEIGKGDPRFFDVQDRTKIEGYMQCEDYLIDYKDELSKILKPNDRFIRKELYEQNVCVINFRGTAEYLTQPHVFLKPEYWYNAINHVIKIDPTTKFFVVTDDVQTAKMFFPQLQCFHGTIAEDYGLIYSARKLIASNSTFAWFPVWTSPFNELVIGPKYWARHNISDGFWCVGDSLTRGWNYLDRDGKLWDYDSCKKEKDEFETVNSHLWR